MTLPMSKPQLGSTGWHPNYYNMVDLWNGIDERIRDLIGATIVAGLGLDIVVNDAGDTVTLNSTNVQDDEAIQDLIAATLVAGDNVTLTYDDTGNTLTVSATAGSSYTAENARDDIAAALAAGAGITVTPNDGADTITIASTITQYTDEMARDALGTALTQGTGITITVNDPGDTITIAATYDDSSARGASQRIVALTDGATITPNSATTDVGTVTIAGNRTIAAPSGTPTGARKLILRIKQDGTGSRTITWDSIYRFSGGTPPTLTTAANKTDYIGFIYNPTDSKWDCVAFKANF